MIQKTLSIAILFAVSLTAAAAQTADVISDANLNNMPEAYALSFRNLEVGMEAWLTVAPTGDTDKRVLALSSCGAGGFGAATVIEDETLNPKGTTYNGVPTFSPCDPDVGVIVSDRASSNESRRSNDLYLLNRSGNRWMATRMSVNTGAWEDTPAFGRTGNTLYFASDRRNPGAGTGDIYLTRREGGGWSDPILLTSICSANDHEAAPFVAANGMLYYTTDRDGSQDIWTVALDAKGMPSGRATKLDLPGVNMDDSDEYHPQVTPGGSFLIFSSNRSGSDGGKAYRLYHVRISSDTTRLHLNVTARTKITDATKLRYFGKLDSIYRVQTKVEVTSLPSESQQVVESDANGVATLMFTPDALGGPFADARTRTIVARPWEHKRGYRAGVDTIIIDLAYCPAVVEHTLYLDDTTSKSKTCDFSFRTFNVPFFITAYWCPTTRKFRSYTPCTSLFTDDTECTDLEQPEHCETDEAYRYTFTPAKLVRTTRRGENCVNYAEFEQNGPDWADEVDASIERMRDEVGAALHEQCIQEAIRRGHSVSVTYIGTTDDRSINTKCQYTGSDYDEIQSIAPDIEIEKQIEPFIKTGQRFNAGGYGGKAGGNQLLSDLRSLYFAILFDNLCRETIPLYAKLRAEGKMIVKSRGEAVDKRDLPYEFKRAAGVEIKVPDFELISKGFDAVPHRTVHLCEGAGPCK